MLTETILSLDPQFDVLIAHRSLPTFESVS